MGRYLQEVDFSLFFFLKHFFQREMRHKIRLVLIILCGCIKDIFELINGKRDMLLPLLTFDN